MTDIIWLDDDKKLMDQYEEAFRKSGFRLTKCTTVAQALKYLTEGACNNLLLDIELPGGDREGIVFLEQLAKLKLQPVTVILTGYPMTEEAFDLGKRRKIANYLLKPIPADEAGQYVFFEKLNKAYRSVSAAHVSEEKLLGSWRLRTWMHLLISIGLFLLTWGVIAAMHSWDLGYFLSLIKDNKFVSLLMGIGGTLMVNVLIKALYDKYMNHSNIKAYLEKQKQLGEKR
jgi:CheY-like chemotaxis protein